MKISLRTPATPFVLVPVLILSPVWGQAPVSPGRLPASEISVRVVSRDGAQLALGSRSINGLTLQVVDRNGTGVADAAVAVRLPDTGPSGLFSDGSHSAVAYTDAAGSAHISGIQWNSTPGAFSIRITATKGESHAGMLLEQALTSGMPAAEPPTPVPPTPGVPKAMIATAEIPSTTPTTNAASYPRPVAAPAVSIVNSSKPAALKPDSEPLVSISSSPGGYSSHASMKKWLIWAAVAAAGAGAGLAFAGRTSSAATSTASGNATTIGTPTISIGHP